MDRDLLERRANFIRVQLYELQKELRNIESKLNPEEVNIHDTMDIYSPEGTKVTPIFKNGELCNGYEMEREWDWKYLKEGEIYTVESISVGQSHSSVILKEVPILSFNTVHFRTVKDDSSELKGDS